MRSLLPSLLLVSLLTVTGCAGANVEITAKRSRYAISMSQLVRDESGLLHDHHSLDRVGTLQIARTRVGFFYSALTLFSHVDISDEVNTQVAAVGGEAVVGMTVLAEDGCEGLNVAAILNILPIWPGCVPVVVLGDIVRRRPSLAAVPPPRNVSPARPYP